MQPYKNASPKNERSEFNGFKITSNIKFFSGPDDTFDKHYTMDPMHLQKSKFIFYGMLNSVLYHEPSLQLWILRTKANNETYATMERANSPIGTHTYEKSEKAGGGSFLANIYNCDDEEEFVCKDGGCVPIEHR